MKITGYELREAIKQHELRRDTASRAFTGSLKKFDDESKETPEALMGTFLAAEEAIARLQTAQMRYNLAVTVTALGREMSLAEAIKRVGGVQRAEKMWKTVLTPKEGYSSYVEEVRDPTQTRAKPTIAGPAVLKLASAEAKKSASLRQAITVGNAISVVIEDLDGALFE